MDVVRELRRKQDDLRSARQALADQMADIDRKIAAVYTVIQIYEPDHLPAKKKLARTGNAEIFSTDCSLAIICQRGF